MCEERPAYVVDPLPRLRTRTRADAAYLQRVAVAVPRDRFVLQGRCPTGRVVLVREVAGGPDVHQRAIGKPHDR